MQFLFLGRYRYELIIKQLILDITMKKSNTSNTVKILIDQNLF